VVATIPSVGGGRGVRKENFPVCAESLGCLVPPCRDGSFAACADGRAVSDGRKRIATFVAVLHYVCELAEREERGG
jgi:hypothetical protein